MKPRIKVLVAEDSPSREFLLGILRADPLLKIVGTAADGLEALEAVRKYQPDLITMDINMPRLNGLEATRRIMETKPTPIIIVSANVDPREVTTTFNALDAGALGVFARPYGHGHPNHERSAQEPLDAVKLMSEVKVVRRWPRAAPVPARTPALSPGQEWSSPSSVIQVVAMGASTGGPAALRRILTALPASFPLPILVVQHIAAGFTAPFAEWLNQVTGLPIRLARDGEQLAPGRVYLAPDDLHMAVKSFHQLTVYTGPIEAGARPSVNHLFRSVAAVYGPAAIGILLTGMGEDGAAALLEMRRQGALTVAQDAASAVVHGMPGEAIRLQAASQVQSLGQGIARGLFTLAGSTASSQTRDFSL